MFEICFPLMAGTGLTNAATDGLWLIMGAFLFLFALTLVPAIARARLHH